MSEQDWTFPYSSSVDPFVDLSSYDAFNQGAPFATFARMRKEDPVAWCDMEGGRGFWSITRHSDIVKLNRDPATLSSARGIRMEDQTEDEYEARKTFQETDPPEHRHTRMLMAKAFAPVQIIKFEDRIRHITSELLDRALAKGELDATREIATQLPMRMLGQILGVPEEDTDWLVKKGDALISNTDPEFTDFVLDKVDTDEYRHLPFRSPAALELFDYASGLLKRVRAGEDVGICSMIMQRNKAGEVMSEDAFRNFFCLVVAAGNDTTRFSLASTIHALANQPSLLDQLREADNKELYQSATDEFIRWASPTTHFRRTATHDFEYGGKRIKEGDKVVLWFLSANRDEDVFESPYEINLTRRPNKSLSFGQGGPHVCLGMFLAKLEVRVVLEELAKRVRIIEQTAQHSYLRSNFILGIKNLPVRMKAI